MLDGNRFWAKMQSVHNHDKRYLDGSFSGFIFHFIEELSQMIFRMVEKTLLK